LNEQIEKLNLGSEGEAAKLKELQTLLDRQAEDLNVSCRYRSRSLKLTTRRPT
jgi:hypothetical protein